MTLQRLYVCFGHLPASFHELLSFWLWIILYAVPAIWKKSLLNGDQTHQEVSSTDLGVNNGMLHKCNMFYICASDSMKVFAQEQFICKPL